MIVSTKSIVILSFVVISMVFSQDNQQNANQQPGNLGDLLGTGSNTPVVGQNGFGAQQVGQVGIPGQEGLAGLNQPGALTGQAQQQQQQGQLGQDGLGLNQAGVIPGQPGQLGQQTV